MSTPQGNSSVASSSSSVIEVSEQGQLSESGEDERPVCRYGSECYRINPDHLKEYSHPAKGNEAEVVVIEDDGQPAQKKQKVSPDDAVSVSPLGLPPVNSHPPLYYLTKVRGISDSHNQQSIGIRDILACTPGELVASAQFNYMIDISWLVQQYPDHSRSVPLLIVHGIQRGKQSTLTKEAQGYPNIKFLQVTLAMYGTHHSKMMLLAYKDGLRVVIHTANLIEKDWDQKTQGVWVSPLFRKSSTGAAPSCHFQKDLLEYLSTYPGTALTAWKQRIREHDMTTARVHLIASVPGAHASLNMLRWGHFKLRAVLQQYGGQKPADADQWPLVGQFSSIGSLGSSPKQWLTTELLSSLSMWRSSLSLGPGKLPHLQLVFPSVENIRTSLEGYQAGGSVPYSIQTASKQPYLSQFMSQWKADHCGRSRAAPHIKTYMRLSPDSTKLAWLFLTSANLSKAAWGATEKRGSQLRIRSYEIGVLFLPREQETPLEYFLVTQQDSSQRALPIPVDLPLTGYQKDDKPWMWDTQYPQPDSKGVAWCPP